MGNTVAERDITALEPLLEKVYQDSGHDFRQYKRGTVTRRLERRLHATGVRTYQAYMKFLDVHPEEYQRLADDLIIKVSGFFRAPYTFQQVTKLVLPELAACKGEQRERSLRFWSAGCAWGEEPYSIAVMLAEFLGHELPDSDISIYATDISRQALKEAWMAVYYPREVEGLPPPILETYFNRRGEFYEVSADIRQMVSFSYFNLTSTTKPPFSNLDCIFCCNVLIYLQTQLQERMLNMLYDSLATPGYLVLGEMETPIGNLAEKLECLDDKAKIYKKIGEW